MQRKSRQSVIEYRNYYLPVSFPVLVLTGDKWKISDIPSGHLHFHNCLEIGVCHSQSGTIEFYNGRSLPFRAGDITCIPRNIPHTTYSAPNTRSRWSYLFFDPKRLFFDQLPPGAGTELAADDVLRFLIPRKSSSRITFLAQAVMDELAAPEPDHVLTRSYLFSLYLEIARFQKQEGALFHSQITPPPQPEPPKYHPAFRRRPHSASPLPWIIWKTTI